MKKILIFLFFLNITLFINAQTTYTVSTIDGGADYNNLLDLQTAINSSTFDGGANINFNRGEIFDGTLTINNHDGAYGSPIRFGAYGSGNDPVITTIDTVTDSWSVFSGNIRHVTLSSAPTEILYLFADGEKQTLGRIPNTGYYKLNTTSQTTTSLVDDDLTQADDYWNGAEIVVHTADWALEKRVVSDFVNSTHILTIPALDYVPGGFGDSLDMGYFFQNDTSCLDVQGEWCYDTATNVLYFYGDPSGITFTYAYTSDLITLSGSDYITFNNITFEKADGYGITATNCDNLLIDSCSFYYLDEAIYSENSDTNIVQYNYIEDIATNGIAFKCNYDGYIQDNELNRIAVIKGEGDDENYGDFLKAIQIGAIYQNNRWEGCDSVIVQRNRIDSIGHSGIHVDISNYSYVRNNYLTQYCLNKADAGGVYLWHNADSAHIPGQTNYVVDYDSSIVANNYLELNFKALDRDWQSTRLYDDTIPQVFNIYIDDGNMNVRCEGNVMIGGCFNLFFHNSGHSIIRDNIGYKYELYGFYGRNNLDANKDTITDTDFSGNIWIEYYDGVSTLYKYSNYFLYIYENYNNTWSNNYNTFPMGKMFGSIDITSGYDDTRGSFDYNTSEWNALSYVTGEDIHPFSYSDTDLSTRDSLIYIAYNFSNSSISTNTLFQDGYGYFDADSTRIQEEMIEAYGSKVYFVDRGDYT